MHSARIATAAFFAALVLLGFGVYKDYGLAWDEPLAQLNGRVSLAYVLGWNEDLFTYWDRSYGVLFDLPFAFAEWYRQLPSRELYFLRHIVSFLFFAVGVFFFYRLCLQRWRSPWFALFGAACLVASPRIFAEAFYNSKDIHPLVLAIICFYTLTQFLTQPDARRMLLHAIPSAAFIAIRLPGVFVPALTLVAAVLHLAAHGAMRREGRKMAALLAGYLGAMALLTILFWPYLWRQPLAHFMEAFAVMSQFSAWADGMVLYWGEFLKAGELPWHYLPVWIIITTPLLYLAGFCAGLGSIIRRFLIHTKKECREHLMDLLVIAWLCGPIVAVIALGSVVYDGWRHLYFVYPALLYIALAGFHAVTGAAKALAGDDRRKAFAILAAAAVLHFGAVSSFMVRNHPYQNVYFNVLAGNMQTARRNFELDYWGLSFREGLEYIARTDPSDRIPVYFAGGSLDNALILSEEDKKRMQVLTVDQSTEAKYILSNYRRQSFDGLPFTWEVYAVRVDGASIMSVFEVPPS